MTKIDTESQASVLRTARYDRGMSLMQLAAITLITPSDLSNIERGRVPAYPSWRRRIAGALSIPEDALFEGEHVR